MDSREARLLQYRVVAQHRLHFGKLYFQVIAVNVSLVAGALVAIAIGLPGWWPGARLVGGLVLVGTALVANRVNQQEAGYAACMREIEAADPDLLALPTAGHLGARRMVVIVIGLAGMLLGAEALVRLL